MLDTILKEYITPQDIENVNAYLRSHFGECVMTSYLEFEGDEDVVVGFISEEEGKSMIQIDLSQVTDDTFQVHVWKDDLYYHENTISRK